MPFIHNRKRLGRAIFAFFTFTSVSWKIIQHTAILSCEKIMAMTMMMMIMIIKYILKLIQCHEFFSLSTNIQHTLNRYNEHFYLIFFREFYVLEDLQKILNFIRISFLNNLFLLWHLTQKYHFLFYDSISHWSICECCVNNFKVEMTCAHGMCEVNVFL